MYNEIKLKERIIIYEKKWRVITHHKPAQPVGCGHEGTGSV